MDKATTAHLQNYRQQLHTKFLAAKALVGSQFTYRNEYGTYQATIESVRYSTYKTLHFDITYQTALGDTIQDNIAVTTVYGLQSILAKRGLAQ